MIILLNGCSSSGKSTIAKAIQHLSEMPWLHIGIDTFIQMMPAHYVGYGNRASEGFKFVTVQDDEGPLTRVSGGAYSKAIVQSIPHVVQTLARDGHDIIVDEVFFTGKELADYRKALENHTVCFIGVFCDLNAIQEREILRGDRMPGLGRDQISRVHNLSFLYDLTVDTTFRSSFDCAREILDFIKNGNRL